MINPYLIELLMSRTNLYGPKDARAIEVGLFFHLCLCVFTALKSHFLRIYLTSRSVYVDKRLALLITRFRIRIPIQAGFSSWLNSASLHIASLTPLWYDFNDVERDIKHKKIIIIVIIIIIFFFITIIIYLFFFSTAGIIAVWSP